MAIWLPYVFHYVLDEQEGRLTAGKSLDSDQMHKIRDQGKCCA